IDDQEKPMISHVIPEVGWGKSDFWGGAGFRGVKCTRFSQPSVAAAGRVEQTRIGGTPAVPQPGDGDGDGRVSFDLHQQARRQGPRLDPRIFWSRSGTRWVRRALLLPDP